MASFEFYKFYNLEESLKLRLTRKKIVLGYSVEYHQGLYEDYEEDKLNC